MDTNELRQQIDKKRQARTGEILWRKRQARIDKQTMDQPAGSPRVLRRMQQEITFAPNYLAPSQPVPEKPKAEAIQEITDISSVVEDLNKNTSGSRAKLNDISGIMAKLKYWTTQIQPEDIVPNRKIKFINFWYSEALEARVLIYTENGKLKYHITNASDEKTDLYFATHLACEAYTLKEEFKAMEKLETHLLPDQFKGYVLSGCFIEKSKRSGLQYIFRRMRPTVAMRWNMLTKEFHFLAALCMHPAAFYSGTWAGAMCPTDDVIAHLLMMRGDEYGFWKRSTQHPQWAVQADW